MSKKSKKILIKITKTQEQNETKSTRLNLNVCSENIDHIKNVSILYPFV